MSSFNAWLARRITAAVASMWCAYLFAALALVSLPDAIHGGRAPLIAWVAQTFLQLVLLSVIMVGQAMNGKDAAARHEDVTAQHDLIRQIHARVHRG